MPDVRPSIPPAASDDDLLATAIPIDSEPEQDDRLDLAPAPAGGDGASNKIRTFDQKRTSSQAWRRQPTATGQGASHVKTFVSKLRLEALDHLDEQVNDWLDEHPEYEVKFVTTSVGQLVGKTPEDAIIMTVWV